MVRPVMRCSTSMHSRLLACFVAAGIAAAPLQTAVAAPSVDELFQQGQDKFDAEEFGEAGDLWGEAVRLLPEDKNNSATRQTLMSVALDAYLRAYRKDEDPAHVEDAKLLIDDYQASLEGTETELSTEIASAKGKVEDILAEIAAAEQAAAEETGEDEGGEDEGDTDEPPPLPVGNDKPGQGLVIGGAALMGVGVVGVGLLLGGVIGGLAAQTDFNDATPGSDAALKAEKRGKTMNALAITGGVVAPVFLGTGIALLVVGLQKNKRAREGQMTLTPTFGPDYTGLSFTGRF